MFPRSANKPMQAAGMLRAGLDLDGKLLALAAASHSGEDFHVAGVREILAGAGLTEDALQLPARAAAGRAALRRVLREGGDAGPGAHELLRQARGHAGHLRRRWLADRQLPATRPTRCSRRSGARSRTWPGRRSRRTGVDGCGAPLFALSLTGLARAFQRLVRAEPGSAERRVADAMRAYPEWTSGTHRARNAR